jgi:hypothetical protein
MFLQVTQITRERLQRLAARADALLSLADRLPIRGGPGIRVETGPHGAVISALATAARPQVAMPGGGSEVRIVRITSNLGTTAYGKYNCRTITATTITYTNWTATTGAPSVSGMFGTGAESASDNAIFLNLEELGNGGSTYVLTDGVTDSGDIYAIGRLVGSIPNDSGTYGANANKLLVAGLSLKFGECE